MGRRWRNLEFWARERVGVTLEDVLAQYRKEGLLLSGTPNEDNCWEIAGEATWDGQIPPLTAAATRLRERRSQEFLSAWDGSIGVIVYPDGREVRMDRFETASLVRLMTDDLSSGEPELVRVDDLFDGDCHFTMTQGFAFKPPPGVDAADEG